MNPSTLSDTWAIFCVYSKERVSKNQTKLTALLEILLNSGVEGVLLVDNSSGELQEHLSRFTMLSDRVRQMPGSNSYAEFSAWVEGMEMITAEHGGKSFILFNDTVFSHFKLFYWKIINFIGQIERYRSHAGPVQLGETVKLPYQSSVMGASHGHFVRSALFYLNKSASALFLQGCRKVFKQTETAFDAQSSFAMLSHFFNESGVYHVGRWLFSGGWYDSKPYVEFNPRLLKLKVTAIACEHLASASCINNGGVAADSNLQRNFRLSEQLSLVKGTVLKQPFFTLKMLRKLKR